LDGIFSVFLSTKYLLDKLRLYGKNVIGLDSVYKFTEQKYPTWLISCQLPIGKGICCAVIVTNDGSHNILEKYLKKLLELLPDWTPKVTIDHDQVEARAPG